MCCGCLSGLLCVLLLLVLCSVCWFSLVRCWWLVSLLCRLLSWCWMCGCRFRLLRLMRLRCRWMLCGWCFRFMFSSCLRIWSVSRWCWFGCRMRLIS